jgi:CDP-glucose 4,6-dehydratase
LVTGHTGFKGSWLCLWLQELGAKVAGYATSPPSRPSNFEVLGLQDSMEHYRGDITDGLALKQALTDFNPHIVFHLAAQAIVKQSYLNPLNTIKINAMGAATLLECLRQRQQDDYNQTYYAVLITTDKVYRNQEWQYGYRETDELGDDDPYSASKACVEIITKMYFESYLRDLHMGVATARAGNAIGGGDWGEHRMIPNAIRAWTTGGKAEVRSPKATRPWLFVLDLLSGYLTLGAELYEENKALYGEGFNFGPPSDVDISLLSLVGEFSKQWGDGAVMEIPADVSKEMLDDPYNRHDRKFGKETNLLKLCSDKSLRRLEWKQVLTFYKMVNMTVNWYKAFYKGNAKMREYSVNQINQYVKLAKKADLPWVQKSA